MMGPMLRSKWLRLCLPYASLIVFMLSHALLKNKESAETADQREEKHWRDSGEFNARLPKHSFLRRILHGMTYHLGHDILI